MNGHVAIKNWISYQNLFTKKTPSPNGLIGEFYHKQDISPILCTLLGNRRNISQLNS